MKDGALQITVERQQQLYDAKLKGEQSKRRKSGEIAGFSSLHGKQKN